MAELRSKCCRAKVWKAKWASLMEKKYCKPFYMCDACNKLTEVEKEEDSK